MSAPCNCLVSQIHWAVVGWEIEIYCEEVPDETKINIVFFYLYLISSLSIWYLMHFLREILPPQIMHGKGTAASVCKSLKFLYWDLLTWRLKLILSWALLIDMLRWNFLVDKPPHYETVSFIKGDCWVTASDLLVPLFHWKGNDCPYRGNNQHLG